MEKLTEPLARLNYWWNGVAKVWEKMVIRFSASKKPRISYPILAVGTIFNSGLISFDGDVLTRYILECGDTTNDVTRTLSIIDINGVTVYTGAALADDANYSIPVDIELVGQYQFRLTLSGVAGNIVTDYLTLLLR